MTPLGLARAFALFQTGKSVGGGPNYLVPNCGGIAEPIPIFPLRDRISDHRGVILRAEGSEFLLVDENGKVSVDSQATRDSIKYLKEFWKATCAMPHMWTKPFVMWK